MAFYSFIFSFFVGLSGISIGVIIGYILSNISKKIEASLAGFAAGIMLSVVYLSILPEVFHYASLRYGLFGICLGIIFIIILDYLINLAKVSRIDHRDKHYYLRIGISFVIGILFHSIPEGMAMGSLVMTELSKAIGLGVILTVHSIPEGVMLSVPFKKVDTSLGKMLAMTCMIGIATGLGGYIGGRMVYISERFLAISLGFAAGVMLYITCEELQIKEGGRINIVAILIGIILGIILALKL